jgi:hypothetical protein
MSKRDFKQMSRKDLKQYILAHRNDEEAWDEFVSRPRPNAVIVSADTPLEEQERILLDALQSQKNQEKN